MKKVNKRIQSGFFVKNGEGIVLADLTKVRIASINELLRFCFKIGGVDMGTFAR